MLPSGNLEESARILTDRSLADSNKRPALTKDSNPYREMLNVLMARHHLYFEAADQVIYTGGDNVAAVADNSWTEKGITYNNRPAAGITLTSFIADKSGIYKEIDITGYVRNNLGKLISLAVQTSSTNELQFKSRNVSDATKRPVLIIK